MMFSRFLPILQQKNKSISSLGPEREFAQRPGARGAVQVGWADREGEETFLSQRPHSPCPLGTPVSGDRVPSVGIPGSTPAADRSLPNRAGSTSKLRCLASELEMDGRPETPQHVQRKSLLWRQVETWRALLSDD